MHNSDALNEWEAFAAKCLARGVCPSGGGKLRLEQWDSHGPTMCCGPCDCFGFDPTDPRFNLMSSNERVCKFGCTADDVAVHYGWFNCTRESRAMLIEERRRLADSEETGPR